MNGPAGRAGKEELKGVEKENKIKTNRKRKELPQFAVVRKT